MFAAWREEVVGIEEKGLVKLVLLRVELIYRLTLLLRSFKVLGVGIADWTLLARGLEEDLCCRLLFEGQILTSLFKVILVI